MKKETSLKKNFIYNMLYEVLVILIPLITTPYIARVMGADNVGIYNYVTANITYFTLVAAFGTVSYAQREIASKRENRELLSEEFWGIFSFRFVATITAVAIFLCFLTFNQDYNIYYYISGISIVSVVLDISWFFQGIENFKVTVIRNTLVKLLATASIFLLVKSDKDLFVYILINVCAVFIGNCTLWPFLRNKVNKFSWKYINLKKNFYGSLKMFIPVVAIQVYTVVDKTMLGMFADVSEVAYYSQAERIIKLLISVVGALAVVLLPRISRLIADGDYKTANEYYRKSIRFSAMFALPCMVGMIGIASDFIPFFFGNGYEKSVPVIIVLSLLFVILSFARIIGTPLLIPLKRENKYTIAVSTGAIINIVLNYYLIPRFAALGAAIATIFAEATVTGMEIFFISDYFSGKEIVKSIAHYIPATGFMFIGILIIRLVMPASVVRLFITVGISVIIYGSVLFLNRDEMLLDYVLKPLKRKIRM